MVECRVCSTSVLDIGTKIYFCASGKNSLLAWRIFIFWGELVWIIFLYPIYVLRLRCNFQPLAFTLHFADVTGDQLKISTTFCTILSSYRCTATIFSQALVNLERIHHRVRLVSQNGFLNSAHFFKIALIVILSLKNAVATIANNCLF